MKLTVLCMTVAILNVSAKSLSQSITFQGTDVPLQQVFQEVEKQTGYLFLYTDAALKKGRNISITANKESLEVFLTKIFRDQPLTYIIKGNNVIVDAKEDHKSAMLAASLDNPPIKISGTIIGPNNQPLSGATIKVKGKNSITISDENGYFELSADAGSTLIVSYVGFHEREVRMLNTNTARIELKPIDKTEAEVVVSTGYEEMRPDRFIGSATVIDSSLIERQVGRDLLTRLDGTANGILFNKTGGSGIIQMQLRGISTLNFENDLNGMSSQNPLIVLDDFPYTGDINNINPNSIESISVLKDAVAASIWGARAGNGVIVIKSKTGNIRRPASLTFSSNFSIVSKPDLDYFPQMSSSDFIDLEQELFERGFYDISLQYPQYFSISPVVDILAKRKNEEITETDAKELIDAFRLNDIRNEAAKHIFRHAVNKQNYLNLSGGTSILGYNLSFGADNNMTSIQGPGRNNRYTLSSKFQFRPIEPLQLSLSIDYNNETNKYDGINYPFRPGSGTKRILPYAELADAQGNHLAVPVSFGTSFLESLPADKMLDWDYRPLDERDLANNKEITQLIRMNFGGRLRLTSWLSGDLKYQYTRQSFENRNLRTVESYFARDLINRYTDPVLFKRNIPIGGILDITSRELLSHNLRGQLNIRRNWSGAHDFTAMIAGEMSQSRLNGNTQRLYGYDDKVLSYANNIDFSTNLTTYTGGKARIPNTLDLEARSNNLVSVLANASYLYDSRYGLYASIRRDGSNLFGVSTNNKYKPLWSVGVRWNLSKESFYQISWLNNLALRVTYGYAGNINNSISALSTIFHSSTPNLYGESYVSMGNAPNPDLRWEEVRTINAAVDYAFLNGRITGMMEVYMKRSKDVIATFPVDPTLGLVAGSLAKNAADLEGRGFDLAVQSQNLAGKFSWITNLNLNYAKTTVSKYFVETESVPTAPIIREGDIYLGQYAYRWAGLDPETGDPRGYIGKEISADYQSIFFDSLQNQQYIGSPFPLYYGNIMNTFSFKGFSISANISFRAKYYFRKPTINYSSLYNNWEGHADYARRWQKPGDELYTNVPSLLYSVNGNRDKFYEYSTINFEKGDHVRLQDIRLSYRWINKHYGRFPIKSFEVFGYLNNLNLMIWKASDTSYDPDYPTYDYPPLRTSSVGLNINL